MRMAGVQYSTASYTTHVLKGLLGSYNLLKQLSVVPGIRESLNEDSLTSFILRDEAMQEAKRSTELLPQPVGGGSGGGKPAKDADKQKSAKDGRPREVGRASSSLGEQAAQEEAVDQFVDLGEGRRLLLWWQGARRPGGVVLAGQRRGTDHLTGNGGRRGLPGCGSSHASEPGGGPARQRLLASPIGFNGALQDVRGRCTVALQGEAGKQVLIPDVLYVPGVQANLLSTGQLKENGVKLPEDGDEMLLVSAARDVLGQVTYTDQILCTDLRPCSAKSTTPTSEVMALRMIVLATKSTLARWHARLAHVCADTIMSSARLEVATGVDINPSTGTDSPCVSCVGGKLARHTFPDKGSTSRTPCELAATDAEDVCPPSPSPIPPAPPLVADLCRLTPVSASSDEGRSGALPMAPAKSIAGGRRDITQVGVGAKSTPTWEQQVEEVQPTLPSGTKESTGSDVVEVQPGPRRSDRAQRPPEFLTYHVCLPPAAFTTLHDNNDDALAYNNAKDDVDLPELDPDMHADPEHRWDIVTMMVKEALASWKGKAVKAAMDEEFHSLIGMGTWELVERLRVVYSADYDETYALVSSYVMLRIFLSIVAVLNLHLMQLDMKNAFLERKLDWVSGDGVACWVLVYIDNMLAASSSTMMLKELLEAAFELREISLVETYLGLEIVHDRSARKLWLHQQGYADKLCRRFINEEQTGHTPKTPVSVDTDAELKFDDEKAQERQEEEYRQKVGSLQFAATTTRPDIAFACNKLGSSLTVRSDQYLREVDHCLAYLANTRDIALEFGSGPESLRVVGYVDADGASDKKNRTSTGGYVLVFGEAAIFWSSQRIKCATLLSTESKYVAATEAGKEGRRLRFLLADFQLLDDVTPMVLRVDNKSAIKVAEGLGLQGNLKHMERCYAWLQHMVKRGKLMLKYIPTTKHSVDFQTKALHFPAFNQCSVAIGLRLANVGDGDDDVQQ
ncbi:unnamed protein product [Closterium sp. NIES-54]